MATKKAKNKANSSKKVSFSYLQLALFAVVFGLVGAYAILQTFAAPGGNGGGGKPIKGDSSLSVVMIDDKNADGLPNYKDTIRFNVTTTATTEPHVELLCKQNGTDVLIGQTGYYDSYAWPFTQNFVLTTQAWLGGAADCTATLSSWAMRGNKPVQTFLATLNFHVNE
jgi:hypothetical protein